MSRTRLERAGEGTSSVNEEFLWELQAGAALLPALMPGLVDLGQAATPTKGNLQMAQRIWVFSILTFAAPIPLGDSLFGVWHDASLSPGSPDLFPSVAEQEVTPMPKEGAGDHGMAGEHSPATSSEEWLLQACRGHWGTFPLVLGTHC